MSHVRTDFVLLLLLTRLHTAARARHRRDTMRLLSIILPLAYNNGLPYVREQGLDILIDSGAGRSYLAQAVLDQDGPLAARARSVGAEHSCEAAGLAFPGASGGILGFDALGAGASFELTTSAHRGRTHSMYLMVSVTHAAQRVGAGRSANTLKLDTALYIYKPLMLGGLSGVAVNVSGTKVDDLPTADVDQFELRSILAKKGTFVASAVSDFVLDPSLDVSSDRAATVTSAACDKLTSAANAALVSFFDDESSALEAGREARRRERALREAEEREEQRLARLRAIEEERFQREMEPRPMRMPEEATSRWGAPPPLRGPPPPPRSQSVRGATERRPLRRGGQTYY